MVSDESLDICKEQFEELNPDVSTYEGSGAAPYQPLLLLSIIIGYKSDEYAINDLKRIPVNPAPGSNSILREIYLELKGEFDHGKSDGTINDPLNALKNHEIIGFGIEEGKQFDGKPSLNEIDNDIEHIFLFDSWVEVIEDDDSCKNLIEKIILDDKRYFDSEDKEMLKDKIDEMIDIPLEEVKSSTSKRKMDVTQLLERKKQVILYGPPGTGKTYKTKSISVQMLDGDN